MATLPGLSTDFSSSVPQCLANHMTNALASLRSFADAAQGSRRRLSNCSYRLTVLCQHMHQWNSAVVLTLCSCDIKSRAIPHCKRHWRYSQCRKVERPEEVGLAELGQQLLLGIVRFHLLQGDRRTASPLASHHQRNVQLETLGLHSIQEVRKSEMKQRQAYAACCQVEGSQVIHLLIDLKKVDWGGRAAKRSPKP